MMGRMGREDIRDLSRPSIAFPLPYRALVQSPE